MPTGSNDSRPAVTGNEASAHHSDYEIASDVPAFLVPKFGSGLREASPSSNILTKLAQRMQGAVGTWRHHLEQGQLPQETGRPGANIERVLLGLLSLLAIVSCAGAIAALVQLKSVKSEFAALQRELLPLKERVAKLDQNEKSREAPDKVSGQKNQPPRENRVQEAPLLLSREEIQLVRDYIKPAPVAGPPTEPIKVGDPVTGETIPFPSPITEKVRKLLGARFTIRNGVILITRNGSHHVDAVIGSN